MDCQFCGVDMSMESHKVDCPDIENVSSEFVNNQMFTIGWICPRCDRIFSPIRFECDICNKKINKLLNMEPTDETQ